MKEKSCSTIPRETERYWKRGSFTDDQAFQYRFQFTNVKRYSTLSFFSFLFFFCCQLGSVSQYMFWKETMITSTKKLYSCFKIQRNFSWRLSYNIPPSTTIHYDSWSQHKKNFVSAQWLFKSFCVCIFFWLLEWIQH